jgi:hypothetical protein
MKKHYILTAVAALALSFGSCSDFLERDPDQILTEDQVFGDANMIKSVLANYYGRVRWGQNTEDSYSYILLDEACRSDGAGGIHRRL